MLRRRIAMFMSRLYRRISASDESLMGKVAILVAAITTPPSVEHEVKAATNAQPVAAESNGVFINEETQGKNEVHPITYSISDPIVNDLHTGTSNVFLDAKKSALPNVDVLPDSMADAYLNTSIGIPSSPKQGGKGIAVHAYSYESPSIPATPKSGGKGIMVFAQLIAYMRGACIHSRVIDPKTKHEVILAETVSAKKMFPAFLSVMSAAYNAIGSRTTLSSNTTQKNDVAGFAAISEPASIAIQKDSLENKVSPFGANANMAGITNGISRNVTASATSSAKDTVGICNPTIDSANACLNLNGAQNNAVLGATYAACTAQVAFAYAVTFLNYCGKFLYETIVRSGRDCIDPVSNGDIDAPVGANDDQFIRNEFTGWSKEQDGEADPSCLLHITEPITLYAAHNKQLQQYKARFFDDEGNLMKEEIVGYGSEATPPDTARDYHVFAGWTPSDMTVTCNTDFYGAWAEKPKTDIFNSNDITVSYENLYGCHIANINASSPLVPGIEYIVIFDDVAYKLVAREVVYTMHLENGKTINAYLNPAVGNSRTLGSVLTAPYTTDDPVSYEPFLFCVNDEEKDHPGTLFTREQSQDEKYTHSIRIYYQEK